MKNIDFLPARYQERSTIRKARLWRLAVIALFGGIVSAAAIGQQIMRGFVAERLRGVQVHHDAALASVARYEQLLAETARCGATADLYAYLQHPWPRSQILAATVRPLPDSIHLTQVEISRQSQLGREPNLPLSSLRNRAEQDQKLSSLHPALRDVKRLREENDTQQTVVRVVGVTIEAADVHRYIEGLATESLFSSVELLSLESSPRATTGSEVRFTLRLIVRGRLPRDNALTHDTSRHQARRTNWGAA